MRLKFEEQRIVAGFTHYRSDFCLEDYLLDVETVSSLTSIFPSRLMFSIIHGTRADN